MTENVNETSDSTVALVRIGMLVILILAVVAVVFGLWQTQKLRTVQLAYTNSQQLIIDVQNIDQHMVAERATLRNQGFEFLVSYNSRIYSFVDREAGFCYDILAGYINTGEIMAVPLGPPYPCPLD